MKQLYLLPLRWLIVALCVLPALPLFAQFRSAQLTWISKRLSADGNIDGYYESLPAGYANTTTRYPLLVYLHGDESVEGTHEDILKNSIPKLIAEGTFPETFRVEGRTHSFIVIAPHYTTKSLGSDELHEAILYIINKYRVNVDRIYLTGMSRGGGYTWQYAGSSRERATALAAIVPIAGAAQPNPQMATTIGNADLPVWATHNDEDYLVPASNTITFVDLVNERKPQPRAQITLFNSKEHEGWTRTYDPDSKAFKGKNIYEWMLQYARSAEAPLPVTLTSYKVLSSAANEVTVSWSVAEPVSEGQFIIERSATQANFTKIGTVAAAAQTSYSYVDKTPLPGDTYYRLAQTGADGTITYFPILKINRSTTSEPALALYPNPITDQAVLKLNYNETGLVTLTVFTTAGASMQQWTVQKAVPFVQQSINLSHLPRGSYVLQVRGQTFQQAMHFIKQ